MSELFAGKRVKVEEEDAFWGLVDDYSANQFFSEGHQLESSSTYNTKNFSISSKSQSPGKLDVCTLPSVKEMKVYLGEMKEEGCMSDIGGVLWEASVLLCCFILSHRQTFITASVLELGAGVGLPGLLLTALKRNYLDQLEAESGTEVDTERTLLSSTSTHVQAGEVGSVCLTDYDSDVLDNLVRNIHHQFRPTCDICYQPSPRVASGLLPGSDRRGGGSKGVDVTVIVKQLDWTDDVYTLQDRSTDDTLTPTTSCRKMKENTSDMKKEESTCNNKETAEHNIFMGSELIYMSSLVSLANVILQSLEQGTQEIVIIQMPSRSGFDEFMSLLCKYKEEQKLEYSVESVSEELYQSAQQVTGCLEDSYLLFPKTLFASPPSVSPSSARSQPRSSSPLSSFSLKPSSESVQQHQLDHAKRETRERTEKPIMTIPKEEFVLLRIWNNGGRSHFPSAVPTITTGVDYHSKPMTSPESCVMNTTEPPRCDYDPVSRSCRVATFNVNNRASNYSHFLELLQSIDLDIICLQECSYRLASRLKRGLGPQYKCVYAHADFCGNAMLTRLPISRSWRVEMEDNCSGEMRSAALAMLSLDMTSANGRHTQAIEICVCATHLCHLREETRILQLEQLLDQVTRPCLLMGDLNSLHEPDYTPGRWREIVHTRKRCQLTPPESRVMSLLLRDLSYRDAARIVPPSPSLSSSCLCPLTPSPQAQTQAQIEDEADRETIAVNNSSCDDDDDNNSSNHNNPDSTSFYDTRVDWLLLPPVEHCRAHQPSFQVAVAGGMTPPPPSPSAPSAPSPSSSATSSESELKSESAHVGHCRRNMYGYKYGYRVLPAIDDTLSDHNLVMADLVFTIS